MNKLTFLGHARPLIVDMIMERGELMYLIH